MVSSTGDAGAAAQRLRGRSLAGGHFEIARASDDDEKLAGRAFGKRERQARDGLRAGVQRKACVRMEGN
jgi:hypothetical protein